MDLFYILGHIQSLHYIKAGSPIFWASGRLAVHPSQHKMVSSALNIAVEGQWGNGRGTMKRRADQVSGQKVTLRFFARMR
jgi:hypothetical protein